MFVALGDSDDGTEAQLAEFKNIVIVPTVWDEAMRKSGLILSVQTNIALEALRAKHPRGWAVYLQADEVLNERDFPKIREDLAKAEAAGCDSLSFRYLHFWQSYYQVAIDWRWYPHEIRAVRLDSALESYGDAQSFRPIANRFETEATVFHYGHVREPAAYEKKKADFGRWWHNDEDLKRVLEKGAKRDRHERTIAYLGPHPSFMKSRITESFPPAPDGPVVVYGSREEFGALAGRVRNPLEFSSRIADLWRAGPARSVLLEPLPFWAWFLRFCGFRSQVPPAMHSPQARPWPKPFRALLKFSEKGIRVD